MKRICLLFAVALLAGVALETPASATRCEACKSECDTWCAKEDCLNCKETCDSIWATDVFDGRPALDGSSATRELDSKATGAAGAVGSFVWTPQGDGKVVEKGALQAEAQTAQAASLIADSIATLGENSYTSTVKSLTTAHDQAAKLIITATAQMQSDVTTCKADGKCQAMFSFVGDAYTCQSAVRMLDPSGNTDKHANVYLAVASATYGFLKSGSGGLPGSWTTDNLNTAVTTCPAATKSLIPVASALHACVSGGAFKPDAPNGSLVQKQSGGAFHLMEDHRHREIPDDGDTFYALGLTDSDKANVTVLPDLLFNAIPQGDSYAPLKDTVLIDGHNGSTYRIEKHQKRRISDAVTLATFSGKPITIPQGDFNRIPNGPDYVDPALRKDGTLLKHDNAILLMDGGKRRLLPDNETFLALGGTQSGGASAQTISDSDFNQIPQGDRYPTLKDTMMITGTDGRNYRMDASKKRLITNKDTLDGLGGRVLVATIPQRDVDRIATGADMPSPGIPIPANSANSVVRVPESGGDVIYLADARLFYRKIPDWDTYYALGFTDSDKKQIKGIGADEYKKLNHGEDFESLKDNLIVKGTGWAYFIDKHKKRMIGDDATVKKIGGAVNKVLDRDLDHVANGPDYPLWDGKKWVPDAP